MKINPFNKEYNSRRKDQLDVNYDIFKKFSVEAQTKEELIAMLEEKFNYVISRIANENAKELLEEMQLS